jgi:lysophospholipase L1-like esterase
MDLRNNRRLAIAILVLLWGCCPLAALADAPAQRSSYWHERTSFFSAFSHQADVVMIGDSLTDGAEWAEMFPGQDIVNRGIDSDTTDGVLARLDTILALQPKQAFVMIGINDFADRRVSVASVFANYRSIVFRLNRAGAKVFVQSTLPCNEAKGAWKSCAALNPKIRQLNARLPTLASADVTFIDMAPLVAADGGLKSELTYDGIHLNGQGYRLWKDAIAPFLPAGARQPHVAR